MVESACENLAGVSASQVEIQSGIQFYDGITTGRDSGNPCTFCSDLIDLESQTISLLQHVYFCSVSTNKSLVPSGTKDSPTSLIMSRVVLRRRFTIRLSSSNAYTAEEWDKINSWIDHGRDFLFTYAGLRQVCDKYLVQDRSCGELYETPQYMYMLISATISQKYPLDTRLDYVRRYYNAISKHKINIPTPIMAGVRTALRQFAAVFLLMLMTPSILSLSLIW